ncbi:hypothetical protein AVL56_11025 [Alteromonas stellipolaris]|uniref:hypothetical protein n=1 Tax=Alteromonas stellipolaris TaxID=233316 RepID=UPI0007704633|nr:hypothetical protein [Alteromonas stellipolaris]AMJ94774.1 hypothetical protein AVL56_11025 [Alteromonas stellipolaris]
MRFLFTTAILVSISVGFGYFSSEVFDSDDLKDIVSVLSNISAANFAIAGLWISQIYPEAMKAYTLPNVSIIEAGEKAERIESLILVVSTSALVLILILVIQFAVPFESLAKNTIYETWVETCKLTLICFLALIQLLVVTKLVYNMFIFSNQLYRKVLELKAHNRLN